MMPAVEVVVKQNDAAGSHAGNDAPGKTEQGRVDRSVVPTGPHPKFQLIQKVAVSLRLKLRWTFSWDRTQFCTQIYENRVIKNPLLAVPRDTVQLL